MSASIQETLLLVMLRLVSCLERTPDQLITAVEDLRDRSGRHIHHVRYCISCFTLLTVIQRCLQFLNQIKNLPALTKTVSETKPLNVCHLYHSSRWLIKQLSDFSPPSCTRNTVSCLAVRRPPCGTKHSFDCIRGVLTWSEDLKCPKQGTAIQSIRKSHSRKTRGISSPGHENRTAERKGASLSRETTRSLRRRLGSDRVGQCH